jgi:hypothetical protein
MSSQEGHLFQFRTRLPRLSRQGVAPVEKGFEDLVVLLYFVGSDVRDRRIVVADGP